jgi:hypothetical protein
MRATPCFRADALGTVLTAVSISQGLNLGVSSQVCRVVTIIGAWVAILLVCLGYGFFWRKITKADLGQLSLLEQALVGLSIVACGSLALGAMGPLRELPGLIFLGVGSVAGLYSLVARARAYSPWRLFAALVGIVGILIFVAWPLAATNYCDAYDSNLYHFQHVRWLRSHGSPLGLGNLHSRLGVQSSFLSLAALFEQWVLAGRSAWFMPAVFPLIGMWWCVATMCRDIRHQEQRLLMVYCGIILAFITPQVLLLIPGLYQDNAAGIAQIILVGECLRLFLAREFEAESMRRSKSLILLLSLVCVTIKLSGMVVAVLAVAFATLLHSRIQPRFFTLLLAFLSVVAYSVRSIMLTGWMAFPIPVGRLPVEWAMPAGEKGTAPHDMAIQTVLGFYNIVRGWARLPGPQYHTAIDGGWSVWWPSWSASFWQTNEARLLWATVGVLALVCVLVRSKRQCQEIGLVVLFGWIPLAYWFVTAPDLRFGAVSFWILWALSVAALGTRIRGANLLSCALPVMWMTWVWAPAFSRIGSPALDKPVQAAPMSTMERTVSGGVKIRVPTPKGEDRCGNVHLPCTPYLHPNLKVERRGGRYLKFVVQDILPTGHVQDPQETPQ